jgi:GNAT superfamily N-acetyltransferase
MGSIRFRQARTSDAARILSIKQAAIGSIDSDAYASEQIDAWRPDDDALDDFERAIESDRFVILLAEEDEVAVAYGVLNTKENRIDAVFVHPEHMGKGLASSLVRQFETRAQMADLPELKIVSSKNAKPFYQSLDYWDFGSITRSINGVDVEFSIMRKIFDFDGDE